MKRFAIKLGRFLTVATPLLACSVAVFILEVFPWMVEGGMLKEWTRDALSRKVFKSRVTYDSIRIPSNKVVVLEGIQIEALRKYAKDSTIRRAVLHFDKIVPFGRIRRIEFTGARIRFDLDRLWARGVMQDDEEEKPERLDKPFPPQLPVPPPPPKTKRPSKYARFPIDLSLRTPSKLATIEFKDSEIFGTVGDTEYTLQDFKLSIRNEDGYHLPIEASGRFKESGNPATLIGRADLEEDAGRMKLTLKLPDLDANLDLDYRGTDTDLTVDFSRMEVTPRIEPIFQELLGLKNISGAMSMKIALKARGGFAESASIRGELRDYSIHTKELEIIRKGASPWSVEAKPVDGGADVTVSIRDLAVQLPARGGVGADRFDVRMRVQDKGGEITGAKGTISFSGLEGAYDGRRMTSDGLSLTTDLTGPNLGGEVRIELKAPALTWQGKTHGFDQPLVAVLKAKKEEDEFDVESGSIQLPGVGSLTLKGSGNRDAFKASVGGSDLKVAEIARRVRQYTGWSEEELTASGRLGIAAEIVQGPKGKTIDVQIAVREANARYRSFEGKDVEVTVSSHAELEDGRKNIQATVQLQGKSILAGTVTLTDPKLVLPLWHVEGEEIRRFERKKGVIQASGILVDGESVGEVAIPVERHPNALLIPETRLRLFDGEVQLGATQIWSIFKPERSITTALTIRNVQLAPILKAFKSEKIIEGTIDGKLEEVNISRKAVTTEGSLRLKAFEGEIVVESLQLDRPMEEDASVLLKARGNLVSMEHLAKAVKDYGVVHGKVDIRFDGRFHYRQKRPGGMQLWVQSKETGTESQMINLKAIRRMMKVAGDRKTAKKMKWVERLTGIKRLYFASLGAYAHVDKAGWVTLRGKHYRLENDTVAKVYEYDWADLEGGKIKDGSMEMIMVGGRAHRINVYQATPGIRIHVDELMKRIDEEIPEPLER